MKRAPCCNSARVVVFDNDRGGLVEFAEKPDCRIGVEVVIVGHRLSLERDLSCDSRLAVYCRLLVRVLTVAEFPSVPVLD